jgi:hypothetical protein
MPKGGCDSCASKDPEFLKDLLSMTVCFVASPGFDGWMPYLNVFRGSRRLIHDVFTSKKPFAGCWGGIYDA